MITYLKISSASVYKKVINVYMQYIFIC